MTVKEAIEGFEMDNTLLSGKEDGVVERNNMAIEALNRAMDKKTAVYTDNEKKMIMNSLMYSPICIKDGKFKFDREKCNMSCYECAYDVIKVLQ